MTRNQIVIEDLVELINEHGGIDSFSQAMSQLTDRAMAIERADVLGAEPYQRTDTRRGYANGFKPKTLHTRLGPVPPKVPQVRGDVSFYPSALTKRPQTERALTLAVAEMYIQGVSTRKTEPILEKLIDRGNERILFVVVRKDYAAIVGNGGCPVTVVKKSFTPGQRVRPKSIASHDCQDSLKTAQKLAESSMFRDSLRLSSPAVPNPCGAHARPSR